MKKYTEQYIIKTFMSLVNLKTNFCMKSSLLYGFGLAIFFLFSSQFKNNILLLLRLLLILVITRALELVWYIHPPPNGIKLSLCSQAGGHKCRLLYMLSYALNTSELNRERLSRRLNRR